MSECITNVIETYDFISAGHFPRWPPISSRWKRKSFSSGMSIGIWLGTATRRLRCRYSTVALLSSWGNDSLMNRARSSSEMWSRSPMFHARWRNSGDRNGRSGLERSGRQESVRPQAIYSMLVRRVSRAFCDRRGAVATATYSRMASMSSAWRRASCCFISSSNWLYLSM